MMLLKLENIKDCGCCPCCEFEDSFWGDLSKAVCCITGEDVLYNVGIDRNIKCPLKPMPLKKVPVFNPNSASYDEEYEKRIMNEIDGWNACIEEILK